MGKEKVILNVYDLAPVNTYIEWAGIGVFHSGLQIHGVEWSFGGHEGDFPGTFQTPPRQIDNAVFRRALLIGETTMSAAQVRSIVDSMGKEFSGRSYDLLRKNCNTFTDALARRILGYGIPGYVNRLAWLGQGFSCCLPPGLGGPSPERDQDGSVAAQERQPLFVPFQGSGQTLSAAGAGASASGSGGHSGGFGGTIVTMFSRGDHAHSGGEQAGDARNVAAAERARIAEATMRRLQAQQQSADANQRHQD